MKTLKQILQKHCDMPTYYRYQNEVNAIKEWLQQKLDDYEQKCNHRKQYHQVLEELLEELQQ